MTELVECNTQLHKTLQGLWSDALTQHKLQQQITVLTLWSASAMAFNVSYSSSASTASSVSWPSLTSVDLWLSSSSSDVSKLSTRLESLDLTLCVNVWAAFCLPELALPTLNPIVLSGSRIRLDGWMIRPEHRGQRQQALRGLCHRHQNASQFPRHLQRVIGIYGAAKVRVSSWHLKWDWWNRRG